jgi:hypothetical protein
MQEAAYADYWRAAVSHRAAKRIAIQGPDEEPLPPEQAERIAEFLERAEQLDTVQLILERVPEETLGAESRWLLIAALYAEQGAISAELGRYEREMGKE